MRHGENLTPEEREQWLADGQRWFDGWQEAGYPHSDEAVLRAYDLVGMSQSIHLSAMLKDGGPEHFESAMMLANLAVEEADQLAEAWKSEHGQDYHSFMDVVEFILYDLMQNGSFTDGRTEGIDMAGWHTPNIAAAYMVKGSLSYDEGKFESALGWQLRAIDVDPVCAPVLLEVAECYKKIGDMTQGLEYAHRALDVAWQMPVVAKARRTIAFCEGELGHHDLCAANLVISNDYDPNPIVANELIWLRQQGWNGRMPLDRALAIAPEPSDGIAVSAVVQEAMMVALRLMQETGAQDHAFLLELLTNIMRIGRDGRAPSVDMP